MPMTPKQRRNLAYGLAFLAPNILGFLVFALVPLAFSLAMAFTNWDLKLHNMFKTDEAIKWVGIDNFARLLARQNFWRYLGNTLFLMIGIPFSIAGSLLLAIMLTRDLRGGSRPVFASLAAAAIMIASIVILAVLGATDTAMTILLAGVGSGILVFGILASTTFYRTMFFMPHFCAGVATFILWKKLYNPVTGPINNLLANPVARFQTLVESLPPLAFETALYLALALMILTAHWTLGRCLAMWRGGELGHTAAIPPTLLLLLPNALLWRWAPTPAPPVFATLLLAISLAIHTARLSRGRELTCPPSEGGGNALMLAILALLIQFLCIGIGLWAFHLPAAAAAPQGLQPPQWLADYHWAKPALMIMGLWGAIGSNNMLLYIAGLSNVPPELYEAADIDGASPFHRFWHITWPMLAPTTFFIAIMATIGGLRGGFEMARTMTMGGPAGSTTFLSYFIFTEGFDTGRLGYSSAVAWTLFAMTFALTAFNWKFGNRYTND